MVRAVSVALLAQIGAFVIAGASLAIGIDNRIESIVKEALSHYTTRLDQAANVAQLQRQIDRLEAICRSQRP